MRGHRAAITVGAEIRARDAGSAGSNSPSARAERGSARRQNAAGQREQESARDTAMITPLLHKLAETNLPLVKRVIVAAAVFTTFTFARMSDLQTLLEGDVIDFQTHIEVYFDRAKNNQRRHSNLVRPDNRAQGAELADRLSLGEALQASQHEVAAAQRTQPPRAASERALFLRVVRGKMGVQAVSRAEFERVVKQELAALGFDVTEITLCSFRVGSMTTVVAMGENFDMMMQHGRWRSAEAARKYVSHSLEKLTSVSRLLNRAVA